MHIFRKRSVKYLENARKITREEQENCPSRVKRVTDWCQTRYGLVSGRLEDVVVSENARLIPR